MKVPDESSGVEGDLSATENDPREEVEILTPADAGARSKQRIKGAHGRERLALDGKIRSRPEHRCVERIERRARITLWTEDLRRPHPRPPTPSIEVVLRHAFE